MEYITKELFLNQSDKIQQVLKDWFIKKFETTSNEFMLFNYEGKDTCYNTIINTTTKTFSIENCIPLFTENLLREFIEEKLETKIYFNLFTSFENNKLDYFLFEHDKPDICYSNLGDDLLLAYWQVACNIAANLI